MLIIHKRKCLLALMLLQSSEGFLADNTRQCMSRKKLLPGRGLSKFKRSSIGSMQLEQSPELYHGDFPEDEQHQKHQQRRPIPQPMIKVGAKPRKKNPAMEDTSFLRKRTSNLLRLTSKDRISEDNLGTAGGMKVHRKSFNFLIDAWAFSGELDAADQALRLLDRMEELHYSSLLEDKHDLTKKMSPDVRSYTKVINALARSMRPDSGELAGDLLRKMEYLYDTEQNADVKPNAYTYTAVIEAHANSGVDGSAERAEEVLEQMIKKYERGDKDVTPTARCFNAVINAYAKSGYPDAAAQAEAVFSRMEGLYMSGVREVKPNTFNYNSLITALANSEEEGSAERAAEILERMEHAYEYGDKECKPTTVSFNAVIDAYAKSGNAQKAEEVLLHMEDLNEAGEVVKPNTRSVNSVINAWAKSKDPDAAPKAEDWLYFMTRSYDKGNEAVQPDVHSYCTVINAWARSPISGKAVRAMNIFRTMVDAYEEGNETLKPNVIAVNAVMNACAYTRGDIMEQSKAMEIAHRKLKLLEDCDFGSPDQVTYGTFLKVCANQMPDCSTRQQIMEVVFKKCIRDGQVGNIVIQQLRAMGPDDLYYRLVQRSIDEDIKMQDLPQDWWCNVVEGKWNRRRNLHS